MRYTEFVKYTVIDVREADEYKSGHVDGAINLPLGLVMRGARELDDMPKDTNLILYCRSGGRADVAEKAMRQQGFTHVTNGINQEKVEAKFSV